LDDALTDAAVDGVQLFRSVEVRGDTEAILNV
jgi:hypothetical protein